MCGLGDPLNELGLGERLAGVFGTICKEVCCIHWLINMQVVLQGRRWISVPVLGCPVNIFTIEAGSFSLWDVQDSHLEPVSILVIG